MVRVRGMVRVRVISRAGKMVRDEAFGIGGVTAPGYKGLQFQVV